MLYFAQIFALSVEQGKRSELCEMLSDATEQYPDDIPSQLSKVYGFSNAVV
jgi:hypothetical protein